MVLILTFPFGCVDLRTFPEVHVEDLVVDVGGTRLLAGRDEGVRGGTDTTTTRVPLIREVIHSLKGVLAVDRLVVKTCNMYVYVHVCRLMYVYTCVRV